MGGLMFCMLGLQNYANDVVCSLRDVCLERNIPMPTVVSESGRALASHHAVMVFDVVARLDLHASDRWITSHCLTSACQTHT